MMLLLSFKVRLGTLLHPFKLGPGMLQCARMLLPQGGQLSAMLLISFAQCCCTGRLSSGKLSSVSLQGFVQLCSAFLSGLFQLGLPCCKLRPELLVLRCQMRVQLLFLSCQLLNKLCALSFRVLEAVLQLLL